MKERQKALGKMSEKLKWIEYVWMYQKEIYT